MLPLVHWLLLMTSLANISFYSEPATKAPIINKASCLAFLLTTS